MQKFPLKKGLSSAQELHQEISSKYPNEKFELDGGGGSNSDLFVDVNCNKSLADKFASSSLNSKSI